MADSKPVSLEEFPIDYFTEREVVQTLLTDASSPLNRVIKHTQAFVSRVRGRKPNSIAEALELALAERLAVADRYGVASLTPVLELGPRGVQRPPIHIRPRGWWCLLCCLPR